MNIQTIPARLDATTSEDAQNQVKILIDKGEDVALDFSGCNYVSSVGLRVILFAFKYALTKNLSIYLIGVDKNVRQVMRITGFERHFNFFETVEDCIAGTK